MELIELLPAKSWTRQEVDGALENACQRAGHVPRVIVDDHGVDLHGGVVLFRQRHPKTAEVYDAKHTAACLPKSRLEKNPRRQEFTTHIHQPTPALARGERSRRSASASEGARWWHTLRRRII